MSQIPPWHLWGTTQSLLVPAATGLNPPFRATNQLANVTYGRPDTWRFLLYVAITNFPGGLGDLTIDFNVTVGVGRSNVRLEPFRRFYWSGVDLAAESNFVQFVTSTQQQLIDNTGPSPVTVLGPTIELLPAQSIQCDAVVTAPVGVNSPGISIDLAAYFAPNMHLMRLPK